MIFTLSIMDSIMDSIMIVTPNSSPPRPAPMPVCMTIHERAYRNTPLTKAQEISNTAKSRVRARVEHVFGPQPQPRKKLTA